MIWKKCRRHGRQQASPQTAKLLVSLTSTRYTVTLLHHGTVRHTCVRISSIVRSQRLTLLVVVYTIDRGNWLSTAQSSANFRSVSSFVTNDKTASLRLCVLDRMFSSVSVSAHQPQLDDRYALCYNSINININNN